MDGLVLFLLGAAVVASVAILRRNYFSFYAQKAADYDDAGERMDLRTHLDGPIICEGVIYGPTGRVSSRFVADFNVTWTGNTGHMAERFTYDDGSVQDREWNLTLHNDGRVTATAPDVVGEGQGVLSGGSLQLRYRIRLPETSGGHVLDTVDWMYLAPNGTIVNRSQFRKFGIQVAELVATMRPADKEMKEAA